MNAQLIEVLRTRCLDLKGGFKRSRNIFRMMNWLLFGFTIISLILTFLSSLLMIIIGPRADAVKYITLLISLIGGTSSSVSIYVKPNVKAAIAMTNMITCNQVESKLITADNLPSRERSLRLTAIEDLLNELELDQFNNTLPIHAVIPGETGKYSNSPKSSPIKIPSEDVYIPSRVPVRMPMISPPSSY